MTGPRRVLRPSFTAQMGFWVPIPKTVRSSATLQAVSGPGSHRLPRLPPALLSAWQWGWQAFRALLSDGWPERAHLLQPAFQFTDLLSPPQLIYKFRRSRRDRLFLSSWCLVLRSQGPLLNKTLSITFHHLECYSGVLLSLGMNSQILNKT